MQRSISLDLLKILLSALVICIHLYPLFDKDSVAGWYIVNGFVRIAVPIFLLINGYFLSSKIEDAKAVRQYLSHLLIVYLVWSAFYAQYYIQWETPSNIIINLLAGYHHLWYLPALMIGIVMLYATRKLKLKDSQIASIALGLYILGYILGLQHTSILMTRNGVFYGFMFIVIGYLIKKYEFYQKLKTWHLLSLSVICCVLLLAETTIYYKIEVAMDIFLTTLVASPVLFMLALKYPCNVRANTFTDYLGYLPTGIYYIHLFYVYKYYTLAYNIYNLPSVMAMSILTIIPLIFINKRVKIFL